MTTPIRSHQVNSVLIVLARSPKSKGIKSRLAEEVGDENALGIYSFMLDRTLKTMDELPDNIDKIVSWTDPVVSDRQAADWQRWEQPSGDLGERMKVSISRALEEGYKKVVMVGTDIPDLTAGIINEAFAALDNAIVSLGPASDGGYYLVGVREHIPGLFSGIRWGGNRVLRQTLDKLEAALIDYFLLDELDDIDTAADWQRWKESDRMNDSDQSEFLAM